MRTVLLAFLLHSLCFVSPLVQRGQLLVLLPSLRVDAHLLLLVADRALASLAAHDGGVPVCVEREKKKRSHDKGKCVAEEKSSVLNTLTYFLIGTEP